MNQKPGFTHVLNVDLNGENSKENYIYNIIQYIISNITLKTLGELQLLTLEKKLIVTLVSLIILLSGLSTASAISIKKDSSYTSEAETSTSTKMVTLYRFGTDGSITPVEVEVEVEEGQDINEAIEEKCLTILENDTEFQGLLNDSVSRNITSIVRSRGRGFHLKFVFTIQWLKSFDFFPLLPPYIFRRIRIPIVYCKYKNDPKAKTTITPLLNRTNKLVVEGPHSVRSIGFFGFKWWFGHISWLGFGIRTGFVGFSISTKTVKL